MNIGFLITARMKSTRLPKKVILKIHDRELIAWMIDRIKLSPIVNEIIIATSTNPQDDILYEISKRENVKCFRGSEEDVVERLYLAAKNYNLDYILAITADCPLVAYDFFKKVVEKYEQTEADLVRSFDLPHGLYLYGIKISAFKRILEIKSTSDTEVWGPYFLNKEYGFKVVDLEIPDDYKRPNYRLTVDYIEDFKVIEAIFDGLGPKTYKKPTIEIIHFLDNNPDIAKINEECKEKFKKKYEEHAKKIK